ncbi:MAG: hypothetical protein HYZ54_05275 [Ignavibacteriae bacterium]|nr:hypothetical protein [Ignavibacteriota bacterium]
MTHYKLSLLSLISAIIISFNTYVGAQSIDKQPLKSEKPLAAVVNNTRIITLEEVDKLIASQISDLQEKIYFIRKNALDNLITKAILEEEAKSRSISVIVLKTKLIPEKINIEQKRVDQTYLEYLSNFANFGEDEAKERIRLDLESHEKMERYKSEIENLKSKMKVNILLTSPVPSKYPIEAVGPSKGPSNAPITIPAH